LPEFNIVRAGKSYYSNIVFSSKSSEELPQKAKYLIFVSEIDSVCIIDVKLRILFSQVPKMSGCLDVGTNLA